MHKPALVFFWFLLPFAITAQGNCFIEKASKNGALQWTFQYDNQNRVVESVQYSETGAILERYKMNYLGASNAIAEVDVYTGADKLSRRNIYQRDAQQHVTKLEVFKIDDNGSETLSIYVEYENSADKLFCMQKVRIYTGNGQLVETTEISYNDANGSYTSKKTNAAGALNRTETWTRDNRSSYEIWSPFPYQSVHNLIGKEITDADGARNPQSFSSAFEYNAQGYPVKETKTGADGTVENYTYSYRCN